MADGDHRHVAQPRIFGDDVGNLGVLARLDDVLVGDPAPLSGALEGLDEGAGIGDALAVLGGDQPFDVKQRRREHGAGHVDDDFEGERRDAGPRRFREGDRLIHGRNRRRFRVAGELEQNILESHGTILRPARLSSGNTGFAASQTTIGVLMIQALSGSHID